MSILKFICKTLRLIVLLWPGVIWADAADGQFVYSLQDAIEQALEGNHQYRSLLNSVEIAEMDYVKARSAFKTKLTGNLNSDARNGAEIGSAYNLGLRKRNESGSAYGVGLYNSTFGDNSLSEIRFSYTLPFFQDKISSGKFDSDRAELDLRHRERMAKIGAEELALSVVAAYYRLSLADNHIDVARGELALAQKLERATRIRAETGRSSELDLQWAGLRIAQAEQRYESVTLQRVKSENSLKMMMGLDVTAPISVDQEIPGVADPDLLLLSSDEVEVMAMQNRAELIGLGEDLDLARRKLRSVPAKRFPGLDVNLMYSLVGDGTSFSDSMSFDDQRFGVGVSMDVDLMGNPDQRQRRLFLFYDDKRRSYERLEDEIRIAVKDAVFQAQEDAGQLNLARESLRLAEKQFQLTELKYRAGSASTQEVLEAQQDMSDARYMELSSRVNYLMSAYRVRLVAGEILQDWVTEQG